MDEKIEKITIRFEQDVQAGEDADALYLKYFSKKTGLVTLLFKELANLPMDEKKEYGPRLNSLQEELKERIEGLEKEARAAEEDVYVDLTLPYPPKKIGQLHPTTETIREIHKFFKHYGFSVQEGPEIETAEYNFEKLNMPENHPARDLQDTLFVKSPDIMLRTHTSSVEARVLTDQKPPIRAVVAGKSYRNETLNKTNLSFFHQYQGLVVEKGINIQHLKGMLEEFHKFLFGDDVVLRFRYKYYPEVSPGMGTDMRCTFCEGEGCPVCKERGWIEVLGSGMIHYDTLRMCGIDPEEYTGLAFGMGLDRLVMLRYKIDDIRKLYGGVLEY